ncbi:hypothetical protein [Paraprevotella clara]|uniref:hypothetical protein n=1 Tax=Paraprevotella clara TaxID=454154 RepID=UPI00300F1928
MKVNSVQSLLGIWVAVLGLSSCAASRRGAYDVRPENRAALYQERKASPHYRMDNEHTFPVYKGTLYGEITGRVGAFRSVVL